MNDKLIMLKGMRDMAIMAGAEAGKEFSTSAYTKSNVKEEHIKAESKEQLQELKGKRVFRKRG